MRIDVENIPDWNGGFDYCRRLLNHSFIEEGDGLEVWREQKFCYKIKSIEEGAKYTVDDGSNGRPRVRLYRARK